MFGKGSACLCPPASARNKNRRILAAHAMTANENDVQAPVIQKQEETLAPQQKPKASKTKKSSKANKKKKEQPEDVQKQPLDSAEIARSS